MRNDWSFYSAFPRGKGGKQKWEVRGSELQETPDRSPVLPLIYPPLLSAGLLRVRQYFHIVLLNTMWPYLLLSPQTAIAYLQQQFAQPLTGVKRPIEAPLDEIWSCQRVPPPQATMRVCVSDKWWNVILSNVLYCLSFHECVVSGYKCVFVPVCAFVCVTDMSYSTNLLCYFLSVECVYAHVALCVCECVI